MGLRHHGHARRVPLVLSMYKARHCWQHLTQPHGLHAALGTLSWQMAHSLRRSVAVLMAVGASLGVMIEYASSSASSSAAECDEDEPASSGERRGGEGALGGARPPPPPPGGAAAR